MLNILAVCLYCMSMLYAHAVWPFYLSLMLFHAAFLCCMSMPQVLEACPCLSEFPCRRSILHVYASCPCCISMLHFLAKCQYCMFLSKLHVHVELVEVLTKVNKVFCTRPSVYSGSIFSPSKDMMASWKCKYTVGRTWAMQERGGARAGMYGDASWCTPNHARHKHTILHIYA